MTPRQILLQALAMADPDHPDFADSPADVAQLLLENAEAIRRYKPAVVVRVEGGVLQAAWANDPETVVELFDFDDADESHGRKKIVADMLDARAEKMAEVNVVECGCDCNKDKSEGLAGMPDCGPDRWQAARTLTCGHCGKTINPGEDFLTDPLGELDGLYCSTACFETAVDQLNQTP